MNDNSTGASRLAIGVDVSDKYSQICVMDNEGTIVEESRILTKPDGFRNRFSCTPARIAIEVGTHSPWINSILGELGHEVFVANPRKLRMIYQNDSKDDRVDAHMLARVVRLDPGLLSPIEHRREEEQAHLEVIKARDLLVRSRTGLVNHARGVVKTLGCKLPTCSAESFPKKVAPHIPETLWMSLSPLLDIIGQMTAKIKEYDKQIDTLAKKVIPSPLRFARSMESAH
jgi:transposase